jgi:flagellar motor switch protein FliM
MREPTLDILAKNHNSYSKKYHSHIQMKIVDNFLVKFTNSLKSTWAKVRPEECNVVEPHSSAFNAPNISYSFSRSWDNFFSCANC